MELNDLNKDIIFTGRRLQELNLVSATEGNISLRFKKEIIATASGTRKGDLLEQDLIRFNISEFSENISGKVSSEIKMHLEYYNNRDNINAIIHAHPVNCISLMLSGISLDRAYLPEMVVFLGSVPTARYATPSTSDVPDSIKKYIPLTDVILLDHHGVVVAAESLKLALIKLETLEHAAESIVKAFMIKGSLPKTLSEKNVRQLIELRSSRYNIPGRFLDDFKFDD